MTAMHRALDALTIKPSEIWVDGNYFVKWKDVSYKTIVKGDTLHANISAASIIAKVTHDELILLSDDVQKYDLHNNMGYGTKVHYEKLKQHGPSKEHRKSFRLC
jgi:ribonuclease HII